VAAARPDLLALQECLGWEDGARLARIAEAMDGAHAFLGQARPRGSGKRYHVAVLSRAPLADVRVHADAHFLGHCIVEARAGDVTLFAAHFDAEHEKLRYVEARYLRSLVGPDRCARERLLLAGDLNSLSPRDPYPDDLAARVRAAGTDKFGHPPRTDVIEELESCGWIDTLRHRGPPAEWITARRDRGGVHIDYRTDYIFASPLMAPSLTGAAVISVDGASDHEAVIADFA
jgi:exodeoxyribonuclease-3